MPTVVTLMAVGEAGVAVPAARVVILEGALARLVCAKVKGPPKPPVVIFWILKVGRWLVMVQAMAEPAAVAAASSVSTLPESDSVPPLPTPEPLAVPAAKPSAGVSVIVVGVGAAVGL